jgi:hypothetical protein
MSLPVFPNMHLGSPLLGQFHRPVGTTRVKDNNLIYPAKEALQTVLNHYLFVFDDEHR